MGSIPPAGFPRPALTEEEVLRLICNSIYTLGLAEVYASMGRETEEKEWIGEGSRNHESGGGEGRLNGGEEGKGEETSVGCKNKKWKPKIIEEKPRICGSGQFELRIGSD